MRQAGVLAAAGIFALQKMRLRLDDDHQNARTLAGGLVELGYDVDLVAVQTNIVRFSVPGSAPEFVSRLKEKGVLANFTGPSSVRMVTHYEISAQAIQDVLRIIKAV
jgi:threonine aldolase